MRKEDNPCYGCVAPKRHLGCHDRCPERAAWLTKLHHETDAHKKAREDEVAMTDYLEFAWKRMRIKERK